MSVPQAEGIESETMWHSISSTVSIGSYFWTSQTLQPSAKVFDTVEQTSGLQGSTRWSSRIRFDNVLVFWGRAEILWHRTTLPKAVEIISLHPVDQFLWKFNMMEPAETYKPHV